jgi:hypothetical protein
MSGLSVRPGVRLRSVACDTYVIVVRAPTAALDLRCGGAPMTTDLGEPDPRQAADPALAGGTQLGKRYIDGAGLEVLVTKAGQGTLSLGHDPLSIQDPKRLPSSD